MLKIIKNLTAKRTVFSDADIEEIAQESLINYLYNKVNIKEIELSPEEKQQQLALFKKKKSTDLLMNGNIIKTKAKAISTDIPEISTLPQIGPLNIEESVLLQETVKKAEVLPQTSLHFRNKLNNAAPEKFFSYKELVTDTWSDLYINEINNRNHAIC